MAHAYDAPIEVDPATALVLEVHRAAGVCAWYSRELAALDDITDRQGQLLVGEFRRERDHLVRCAKLALDAGVAEREVRLAEAQGQLIATVILAALHEMDLSPAQLGIAKRIVAGKLRDLRDHDGRRLLAP